MNIRQLSAVAALAASLSAPAMATVAIPAPTLTFGGAISTGGPFTDVLATAINLSGAPSFNVSGGIASNDYTVPVQMPVPGFGLLTITLNASSLSFSSLSLAALSGGAVFTDTDLSDGFSFTGVGAGAYKLLISGNNPNTTLAGVYGGTINVTPVPEPETLALALAGLGVAGTLARRRAARV